MKAPYISELQPNEIITATFLVHLKDVRHKKSGEPYLSLLLGDRTGELEAKMWDNVVEVIERFERDDFVKIKGLLQIYQNRPQLTIHKMVKVHEGDVDFADYFPASERSPDEMFAELHALISGIGNPHLRRLLDAFMDDEKIARMYRIAPAAKSVHHAYLGGLIEHVLSVCSLSKSLAAHYRNIDLDLLLTGAVLHDIGKVAELTYDRSFGYSAEGQLLGHIVIGLRMLDRKLHTLPDFPPRLRTLIEHMIVSHHGELEFGSPKVPLFPEALLLHHLDNMDSKMECMRAMLAKDRQVEGCWTVYNHSIERAALKKIKFLEEIAEAVAPAVARVVQAPPPEPEPPKPAVSRPASSQPALSQPALSQPALSQPAVSQPVERSRPPAPPPQRSLSLFAEKLQQAVRKDS